MFYKIFQAMESDDLLIQLPEEYLNKKVEVIAFEVNSIDKSDADEKEKALRFFNQTEIDMSRFTFNREEANAR